MKTGFLDSLAIFLLVLGGINWGLVAWTDFNIVTAAFGWWAMGPKIIYSLVGLAGIYGIWMFLSSLTD